MDDIDPDMRSRALRLVILASDNPSGLLHSSWASG